MSEQQGITLATLPGSKNLNEKQFSGPLAKSCPIPANYSFSNMPIDGQLFPSVFVPSGQYYVSVEVLTNNVRVVLVKVYFEIPAGRTIEDDRMG